MICHLQAGEPGKPVIRIQSQSKGLRIGVGEPCGVSSDLRLTRTRISVSEDRRRWISQLQQQIYPSTFCSVFAYLIVKEDHLDSGC